MKKEKLTSSQVKAADRYPGASIDIADNEKVDSKLVRDRVKTENNNPQNNL